MRQFELLALNARDIHPQSQKRARKHDQELGCRDQTEVFPWDPAVERDKYGQRNELGGQLAGERKAGARHDLTLVSAHCLKIEDVLASDSLV